MTWISGPCLAPTRLIQPCADPALIDAVLDLIDAAYDHGRAAESRNHEAAIEAHRRSLAATNEILTCAARLAATPAAGLPPAAQG